MKAFRNKIICSAAAVTMCLSAAVPALAADFTVNASAGNGGSISPKYNVTVPQGEDLTFTITPDEGYKIDEVTVDGKSVDDVEKYTFYNLSEDHIINVTFKTITKSSKTNSGSSSNSTSSSSSSASKNSANVGNDTDGYTKIVGEKVQPKEEDTSAWNKKSDAATKAEEENKDKIFYITTSYGTGGKISPNNKVKVNGGEDISFDIIPNSGYVVKGVYIDDIYGGKRTSYTFSNVAKDHTIRAEFETAANAELKNQVNSSAQNKIQDINVKYSVADVENPYTDITNKTANYSSILNLYKNDVLLGTAANEFSPSASLTRQEAARAFYRIERIVKSGFSNPYSDVSESSTYRDPIAWSYHMNIISPESVKTFDPAGTVTKEELCQMIYNYAKYTGAAPKGSWAINLTYTDMDQLSSDKAEAVMYCTLKSIITKPSNGELKPKSVVTRSEAAEILNNAMLVTRRDSGKTQ